MPQQSLCRDCGEPIYWVISEHGRRLPPLAKMGKMVVVVFDDVGYTTPAYEKHYCSEKALTAMARKRAAEEEQRERHREEHRLAAEERARAWRERQERRDEVDAAAALFQEATMRLTHGYACPKCEVAVGEICENLTERKRGNVVKTKTPHKERIALIPFDQRPYWKDQFTVVVPDRKEP